MWFVDNKRNIDHHHISTSAWRSLGSKLIADNEKLPSDVTFRSLFIDVFFFYSLYERCFGRQLQSVKWSQLNRFFHTVMMRRFTFFFFCCFFSIKAPNRLHCCRRLKDEHKLWSRWNRFLNWDQTLDLSRTSSHSTCCCSADWDIWPSSGINRSGFRLKWISLPFLKHRVALTSVL